MEHFEWYLGFALQATVMMFLLYFATIDIFNHTEY